MSHEAAAGTGIPGGGEGPGRARVFVADLGTPEPALPVLEETVSRLFELTGQAGAVASRMVLVKPNILASVPSEMHVTTSPPVVRAVVRTVRALGGRVVVGDNPGGVERNSLRTAEACGILAASEGCFRNLSDEVVEVPSKSPYASTFVLSRLVLEADHVVNVPVFKTHMLTTLTGAVKNCYGYVAGANKARLHLSAFSRGRFAHLFLDIYSRRIPDLNIVDALYVMEGNGPTHGRVRPLGRPVAGTDGLAVDAVLTRMMGLDPLDLRLFQKAAELEGDPAWGRLGRFRSEEVEVLDLDGRPYPLGPIPDFALPSTFNVSLERQAELLIALGTIRPVVRPELCVGCGDCTRNCPPQAITLDPYPVVDGAKCISCFCCAELCTEGAMEVPAGQAAGLFDQMFR